MTYLLKNDFICTKRFSLAGNKMTNLCFCTSHIYIIVHMHGYAYWLLFAARNFHESIPIFWILYWIILLVVPRFLAAWL